MADDRVSVEISIEEKQALKALTALTKGVNNFEKTTTKSVKKSDAAFDSFKGNLAAIATSGAIRAIAGGLQSLVVGSFEAAAATEKLTTQFEVLTGSTETASKLFQELTDFSASTPFQLNNIAEAGAQLLSFGFSADTVRDRIAKIGEVAAGSNSDLKEVALIYGQVAAAGKLTGERLLQLQERAVPIGSALAKSLGVAEAEVKDLVSSGVVGFKEFEEAFNSMSESGGIFEGAIDKQSKTINGSLSTLADNFAILQTEIGKTFAPDVVDGIKLITQSLQDFTGAVIENKDGIAIAIGFVRDYITVYLGLAASALKTDTALEKVDEKIIETSDRIDELKSLRDKEGIVGTLSGILRDRGSEIALLKDLQAQEKSLTDLVAKRKALLNQDAASGETAEVRTAQAEYEAFQAAEQKKADAVVATNAKILEERNKLTTELALLQEDQDLKAAERELAKGELDLEGREAAIESIRGFEQSKTDIVLDAELDKNKKIRDADTKALADKIANRKAQIATEQTAAKAQAAINDAKLKNQQQNVAGFGRALAQASSLAKKDTAEQKALAIASATINTYAASTRAFRDYPYPANIAVMATTIAAGLSQVQQITKASFNTGGVVGGFSGATNGLDNTSANVRTGEMILNANQQKQLFDIAAGRGSQVSDSRMIEITSIVQMDEREIARAVRNQRIEGFA